MKSEFILLMYQQLQYVYIYNFEYPVSVDSKYVPYSNEELMEMLIEVLSNFQER